MPNGIQEKLSSRESEVPKIIFPSGSEASVEDVPEKLTELPSYSAARALLARMKRHHGRGRTPRASFAVRLLARRCTDGGTSPQR